MRSTEGEADPARASLLAFKGLIVGRLENIESRSALGIHSSMDLRVRNPMPTTMIGDGNGNVFVDRYYAR